MDIGSKFCGLFKRVDFVLKSTFFSGAAGVAVDLENGGTMQGRRPLVPSHPDASVLPNVSRPPPPFLLRPMLPPPLPHYIASHGMLLYLTGSCIANVYNSCTK